jgi:hypothetical protein
MNEKCIDCGRPLKQGEVDRCPHCVGKKDKKTGTFVKIGLGVLAVAALAIKVFTGVDIGKPS